MAAGSGDAGYLLDTNVVVALVRNNQLGQRIEAAYNLRENLHQAVISVVTVGEMHSLASQFGWGDGKRRELEDVLGRIVWIDISSDAVIRAYGAIDAACTMEGRPMEKNDVWIAATASASKMTLLTTDRDFDRAHGRFLERVWIGPVNPSPAE